jgi:hypothetical protein
MQMKFDKIVIYHTFPPSLYTNMLRVNPSLSQVNCIAFGFAILFGQKFMFNDAIFIDVFGVF